MDIDYLLERLEEVLTSGSRVPFSRRSLIDEEECMAILEQIRAAVPDEMKRAQRVNQERDRILAEAKDRVDLMLVQAREEASELLSEHSAVRAAQARADQIESHALHVADEVRREADQYAYRILERLDRYLTAALQTVRRGMRELEDELPAEEEPAEDERPDPS